jgi:S-adenosylmethionine synthetase
VPVLYGESVDINESSITALTADVLAPDKPKRVDDWSARFPTHTADVGEVIRRVVARGFKEGGAFLSGTHHFSSKERTGGVEGAGRPHTKYSLSMLIGAILGKPTDHLAPDPDPPAGGAARPKDCA